MSSVTTLLGMDRLFDVAVDDRREKPTVEDDELISKRIWDELATLKKCGVVVTRILLGAKGVEPRYDIVFPSEGQSFMFRTNLERELFDVGQQMGEKMLTFYATKRTQQTKGWEV